MGNGIVVGVDSSETALAAARRAAELAVALNVELHVISAYGKFESERIEIGREEILLSTENDAFSAAEAVVATLRADFPSLTITPSAAGGKPGVALVETAEEIDASIIVVGNKRVQGVARVLGSIARDVAAHAPCDVFVVHTHSR